MSRRLKAAGSQKCLTEDFETDEIKQEDKMCFIAAGEKRMTRLNKALIYYLYILQAFGAANQQFVVGPHALPIEFSQQDHLWKNQHRQKCYLKSDSDTVDV